MKLFSPIHLPIKAQGTIHPSDGISVDKDRGHGKSVHDIGSIYLGKFIDDDDFNLVFFSPTSYARYVVSLKMSDAMQIRKALDEVIDEAVS